MISPDLSVKSRLYCSGGHATQLEFSSKVGVQIAVLACIVCRIGHPTYLADSGVLFFMSQLFCRIGHPNPSVIRTPLVILSSYLPPAQTQRPIY
jgi:hypothetical protein